MSCYSTFARTKCLTVKLSRQIKSNQCNCEICAHVRVCLSNYESFEPEDELAIRFKKSIQEAPGGSKRA